MNRTTPHSFTTSITLGALAASLFVAGCGQQNAAPAATVAPADTVAAAPVPPATAPAEVVPAAPAPAPAAAPAPAPAPAPVQSAQRAPVPPPVRAQPYRHAQPPRHVVTRDVPRHVASARLGQVRSIEAIRSRPPGSGTGAVVGGVVGGLLGNQIGKGNGRTAATAVGAVGGAVVGNNVERNRNTVVTGYRISVRLDNGQIRTFQERQTAGLRVGDRVRVERDHLRPA